METLRKVLVVAAMLGAGAGVGSVLFALVTPGELQKQAILREMPRHGDEAARTKELVMAVLKEAAATQENVAWRKNWTVSGGGGGGGGGSS